MSRAGGALALALLLAACASPTEKVHTDCRGYLKLKVHGEKVRVTTRGGERVYFTVRRVGKAALLGRGGDPEIPYADIARLDVYKQDLWFAGETLASLTPVPLLLEALDDMAEAAVHAARECS